MMGSITTHRRWNLFARELDTLLQKHDLDWYDLIGKGLLHREQVRRLKQSLAVPRFHLLSPEDLEQIMVAFQFTEEECLRLRAAVLATAIEATLMNRIDSENALQAAEEIFPLLLHILRQRLHEQGGLAASR